MPQEVGPIMLDLLGTELTQEEGEILQHPLVGGVIFFARNYESSAQFSALSQDVRAARKRPLLLAVDQEGGRVQRFKEDCTRLPSMGMIGELYEENPNLALKTAYSAAWVMASEILALGLDLSFAPVLDLRKVENAVVGDRAFHSHPDIVIALAKSWIQGMHAAGMVSTGKHFPGHGGVILDSHHDLPTDERSLLDIAKEDMQVFEALIPQFLEGIMPAHIIFSEVDKNPTGFSKRWLKTILREQLQFSGMIFSDDLNMQGAAFAGDYPERAKAVLEAGCDMALICNNRSAAIKILDTLSHEYFVSAERFKKMQGKITHTLQDLKQSRLWKEHSEMINLLNETMN